MEHQESQLEHVFTIQIVHVPHEDSCPNMPIQTQFEVGVMDNAFCLFTIPESDEIAKEEYAQQAKEEPVDLMQQQELPTDIPESDAIANEEYTQQAKEELFDLMQQQESPPYMFITEIDAIANEEYAQQAKEEPVDLMQQQELPTDIPEGNTCVKLEIYNPELTQNPLYENVTDDEAADENDVNNKQILPLNFHRVPSSEMDLDVLKGWYHLKLDVFFEMTIDLQKCEIILDRILKHEESIEDLLYLEESNGCAKDYERKFDEINRSGLFTIQNLPILSKYIEIKQLLADFASTRNIELCYKAHEQIKPFLIDLLNTLIYIRIYDKENMNTPFSIQ